ncbi:predicted protein [Thalassiosira pseudonana CCMP1335]|uniref:Uncharacterized protein n=1 Tax=Thalassiosira pseudonana TaxID=35128 RepID=B8C9E6_THAPS|nr:predicted protein [Thalassiosira pseudonana CCMP1335]EED89841.1 predicted protein [Thalassiosira pseudonana CCMP1335]
MATHRIENLERERESFVTHEQRVIKERDVVLKNIRDHIGNLDSEIVALGGKSRDENEAAEAAPADGVGEDFVQSVTAFPHPKKRAGRPRKSSFGDVSTDGKRRSGRTKSSSSEEQQEEGGDDLPTKRSRGKTAKAADGDTDAKACSEEEPPKKRRGRGRPPKDEGNGLTKSSDLAMLADMALESMEDVLVPQRISIHPPGDWACECGVTVADGKVRCGKCRRWRGGKREVRWKVGGIATTKPAAAEKQSRKKRDRKQPPPLQTSNAAIPSALAVANVSPMDVYSILTAPLPGTGPGERLGVDSFRNDIPVDGGRSEVKKVLEDMVLAVHQADATNADIKKRVVVPPLPLSLGAIGDDVKIATILLVQNKINTAPSPIQNAATTDAAVRLFADANAFFAEPSAPTLQEPLKSDIGNKEVAFPDLQPSTMVPATEPFGDEWNQGVKTEENNEKSTLEVA